VSISKFNDFLSVAEYLSKKKYSQEELIFTIRHLFESQIKSDEFIRLSLSINFLIKDNNNYFINEKFEGVVLKNKEMFKRIFLEIFFEKIRQTDYCFEIFSSNNIVFESRLKSYSISKNAFGFRYSNLMKILASFDFITEINIGSNSLFKINNEFIDLLGFASEQTYSKKISVAEFERILPLKQKYGLEAEEFVLNFERKRLSKKEIFWISQNIVNEGYDIASYNSPLDTIINRFIEVKSYRGNKEYFTWSKNEVRVSKIKRDSYWLYLVNRDLIGANDYHPVMIQNPFESIFNNSKWSKDPQSWKFELKDNA